MLKENFNHYSLILDQTARRVKQYAQASFSLNEIDLTVDQWAVLKTLYENTDLTQKELADKCGKDQPTLTRIVDLIIKKDYIKRIEHPSDRRCLHLQLTEAGLKKVEDLAPTVSKFREKAWENLTKEDFEHFTRILNKIYQNLEQK
ncbi:MarR family winged helix-turn-helix transcriptional regulator [Sphingobacterium hungaricum]|uniref:MarR family transcriptional regulator n=1 Tax=Sphingobacterium hungaricum TaxID=2082723 RepID=A0A928YRD6_9SPHI|nr:MarR family transcriptional regulator [Sphingobacterium hungaricum]MBE8714537.1 MarR family transcriptional regulator [Sphingobacterium hungaricum]